MECKNCGNYYCTCHCSINRKAEKVISEAKKYQKIIANLYLIDQFPAIVLEDGTIRIEIIRGCFFDKERFYKECENFPYSVEIINDLKSFFNGDYKNINGF